MRPGDKEDVRKMVETLWEGHDYLPFLFDSWVKDGKGLFVAVEYGERLAGCAKLTWLTDKDAWLEGLRSDMELKARGIGRATLDYLMPGLAARNPETVRFATYWGNIGSIKNSERFGFIREKELNVKSAETGSRGAGICHEQYRRVESSEEKVDLLRSTSFFEKCGGYILDGWRVYPVKEELFPLFCSDTRQFRRLGNRGGDFLSFAPDYQPGEVKLTCFECSGAETGRALLSSFLREMRDGGVTYVESVIPDDPLIRHVFASEGMISWEREHDYWIYSFPVELLRERYGQ
jgi:hypothetical protein